MKSDGDFQKYFLMNPMPMWIYDLESLHFLSVNLAAIQGYGYSREEFLNMTLMDIRPPEDIPALLENISHVGNELDQAGVWRHMKKNGDLIYVDITSYPLEHQGRRGELVMSVDVTERVLKENALRHRLAVENAITDISSRILNTEDTDTVINEALGIIGGISGASRSYLFLFRNDGKTMDNTHEWCAQGVHSEMGNCQGLSMEMYSWSITPVLANEAVTIDDVAALPAEALNERRILAAQGVKSLIMVPVLIAGRVMGFLGFDNAEQVNAWKEEDLLLLRLAAQIIGSAQTMQRGRLALQESEARYRRLVEELPDIVYTYSPKSGACYWSPRVKEVLGFDSSRLETDPFLWHDAIHPQDLPVVDEAIKSFSKGKSIKLEYRIQDLEGNWHWLLDRSVGRHGAGDDLVIEGIATDITDRKLAEQALFEESERVRVTLHSIGDAVISTDASGHIMYLNPVAERLTGWQAGAAAGQYLGEVLHILHEETRQAAEDPVIQCLRDKQIVRLAGHPVLLSRTGQEYSIESSVSPIWGRDHEILGIVLVFKDVTEARNMSREISFHAAHDGLTGLLNRREFEQHLGRVVGMTRSDNTQNALLYFDLDQFKLVNDTSGHVAGDELLRQLGHLLQLQLRHDDILARLGGDEFGLIVRNCSIDEATHVAEKLIKAISEFQFVWENRVFNIGVSIGLVAINDTSERAAVLLSTADTACYVAKEHGRNRVHVHHEGDEALAKRHGEMRWAVSLPRALEENRFELFYQPIAAVSSSMNNAEHYELLVRLLDSTGDLVLPGVFLPAAERFNLANLVDRWVISTACEWFASHPESLERLFLCAINISGHTLGDREFQSFVKRQLEKYAIPAEKICFEITETMAIANLTDAKILIKSLKDLGCRFALDDFGSGLSSFAYLKNLPVDFLKIDGIFVKDILSDPIDAAMVKSINEIGQIMGKQTIAEFVESDAILEKLREIGVDYAQGYGIGRPQPLLSLEPAARVK
ncbi:MAG: EAL domain-containing protein [Gammaproteobacteria bacterium]|nr:EAL domain-containing protein [Gammaproteobacteria bacterium]